MKQKYYLFDELVDMIDEPHRSFCWKVYSDNKEIFEFVKGSNVKYYYWEGGYIGHLSENSLHIFVRCEESNFLLTLFLLPMGGSFF